MILPLPAEVAAQICGACGLAGTLAWSFAPSRGRMLAIQLATQPGFILHWALLGDGTAALASFLLWVLGFLSACLGRGTAARQRAIRFAYLLAVLPIAAVALLSWHGPVSAFALFGTAVSCYARWQTHPARFRDLLLASSLPWLAHDALIGSVPAVCADLVCLARALALHLPRGFGRTA